MQLQLAVLPHWYLPFQTRSWQVLHLHSLTGQLPLQSGCSSQDQLQLSC